MRGEGKRGMGSDGERTNVRGEGAGSAPKLKLLARRTIFLAPALPLLPEILGQSAPVGAKSPILNRYSLVAPQP